MADQSVASAQPRNLKQRAFEEFKRFVAILLYLWLVFGLLSIHTSLVLSQRHLDGLYKWTNALLQCKRTHSTNRLLRATSDGRSFVRLGRITQEAVHRPCFGAIQRNVVLGRVLQRDEKRLRTL